MALRSLTALLAVLVVSAAAQDHAGAPGPLDITRLAVLYERDVPAAERLVAAGGVLAAGVVPTGAGDWCLLDLERPLAGVPDAAFRAGVLGSSPGVAFASPVFHGREGAWVAVTPYILVGLHPEHAGGMDALLPALAPDLAVAEKPLGTIPGAARLRSPARSGFEVLAAARRLAGDPRVAWAEPDMLFSGRSAYWPNDPGRIHLWGLRNTGQFGGISGMDMDVDQAWDVTQGSGGIGVLIMDTGVQLDHPDLNTGPGADFTGQGGGGGPVNACDRHGTPVAGCVSARINNGLGIVGAAPYCPALSARVFISNMSCNGSWTSQSSWTVNALAWGQLQGARVSNNSNSYGFTSSAIAAQYQASYAAGMVHFASAGNDGVSSISYPASIPVVNSVAALTPSGVKAGFSNYGAGLDFSAPGTSIYSTDRTGAAGYDPEDYAFVQGTSFASPYAAAVAALLLSPNPTLTPGQVESRMQGSCRDLGSAGYDTTYGWGFVNAYAALRRTGYFLVYGAGKAGTGGAVPLLFPAGSPTLGSTVTLNVRNALGGTTGWLFLGFGRSTTPSFPAPLHVQPPTLTVCYFPLSGPPGAPGMGTFSLPLGIPSERSLIGLVVDFQAWIWDPGATFSVSATNGLELAIGE